MSSTPINNYTTMSITSNSPIPIRNYFWKNNIKLQDLSFYNSCLQMENIQSNQFDIKY